jgi:hypothetical protein
MVDYLEFEVRRGDNDFRPGQISDHMINDLYDADLVIADLSLHNPNVFYEVGIRHMVGRPIIHLQLESEEPAFDVAGYRSVKLALSTVQGVEQSRTQLKDQLIAVFDPNFVVTNPVKNARGVLKIEQGATPADILVSSELSELRERINSLELAARQASLLGSVSASPTAAELTLARTFLEGARTGAVAGDPWKKK